MDLNKHSQITYRLTYKYMYGNNTPRWRVYTEKGNTLSQSAKKEMQHTQSTKYQITTGRNKRMAHHWDR